MALKKLSKKSNNVVSMFNKDDLESLAREYADLSKTIKELSARKTKLSSLLKDYAEQYGVVDDKGSKYLETSDFVVGKVAKRSVTLLQEEGVAFLKEVGHEECIDTKTVQTVNEQKVENLITEGVLEPEVIKEFTEVKTSYQVSLVQKEELPAVQETVAAKGKKRR